MIMNTTTKPMKQQQQQQPQQRPERTVPNHSQYLTPAVDIVETRDAYVLESDMPGVTKENLEILLESNELTIVGRRLDQSQEAQYVYRESKPAYYRRVFELDPAIDVEKIDARMDQGVLTLTLPKSERVKPRKITVTD